MKKQILALTLLTASFSIIQTENKMMPMPEKKPVVQQIADAIDKDDTMQLQKLYTNNPELFSHKHFMGVFGSHKNNYQLTPLMYAVFYGSEYKTIHTLLNFAQVKENINNRDRNGSTALMMAAETKSISDSSKKIRIIKLLHKNGANLDLKNNNNETAYDLASDDAVKKAIENLYPKKGKLKIVKKS